MFGKKKRKKVRIPVSEYEYYLIPTFRMKSMQHLQKT